MDGHKIKFGKLRINDDGSISEEEIVEVSQEELMKDNPTFCLSPDRATGRCDRCETYRIAKLRKKEPRCNPVVQKSEETKG